MVKGPDNDMTLLSQVRGESLVASPRPHVYVCSLKHFMWGFLVFWGFFFGLSVPVTYSPTTASN